MAIGEEAKASSGLVFLCDSVALCKYLAGKKKDPRNGFF
jgi:hypothetical protein